MTPSDTIKPESFRLGNLIQDPDDGEIYTITNISTEQITAGPMTIYKIGFDLTVGIPLSPKWLERAGFEKLNVSGYVVKDAAYWRKGMITIYGIKGKYYVPLGEKLDMAGRTVIEFDKVHELQNIFALTGSELTFDKT